MTKTYWMSIYRSVNNADALAEYAKLAGPAVTDAGGKFLARGMPAAVKESGEMQRVVLIEFESLQAALDAYGSPGYKAALKALGDNAVVRDIRIIEGT
ncbi:MAG: DUF1330 domain-containing protein [Burkholderiaceae bacterium]|nr:DUF1330 domain-containing protein [Burkholderiaceae bacterium]